MYIKVLMLLYIVVLHGDVSFGKAKCLKCPPGWGVFKMCTRRNKTICEMCINGETYSDVWSAKNRCWSCSRCGLGLYEAESCSSIKDTVCDECINSIGHKNFSRNNDFLNKCRFILS